MTNISPATHKGLSEVIISNIETHKKNKAGEEVITAFKANLDTLRQIYNEYNVKLREIRELIELYDQVQNCVRVNIRKAKHFKKGSTPLVKTKVLFNTSKNAGNILEISEAGFSRKKTAL